MENKTKIIYLLIVFLVIGGAIGYGIEYSYNHQQTKKLISGILPVRENNFNYKFIYPLLRYDFGDAKYYLENKDLEQKISSYIQQQYQNKNADQLLKDARETSDDQTKIQDYEKVSTLI